MQCSGDVWTVNIAIRIVSSLTLTYASNVLFKWC